MVYDHELRMAYEINRLRQEADQLERLQNERMRREEERYNALGETGKLPYKQQKDYDDDKALYNL